jgi:hypothetical protein
MLRLFLVVGLAIGLSGCIVAPPYGYAPAPGYGYGYGYAPAYYAAPTVGGDKVKCGVWEVRSDQAASGC